MAQDKYPTVENIYDYFTLTFGQEPEEKSLKELPVTSPCGLDCKKLIDRGALVNETIDRCCRKDLLNLIEQGVNVFWIG